MLQKKTVLKLIMVMIIIITLSFPATEDVCAGVEKMNPLVIVLDPGHDATHGGAVANGLSESVLNFKIAQYCYEELSTYNNVKVYMTRYSAQCPNPGTTSKQDNAKRVEFAQSVGADAYIALHLNSANSTSVNGVEVYYPNKSYKPELSTIGEGLSQSIINELTALGIKNRGIRINDSNDLRYPDGSVADAYQVIRTSKAANITGMIVEHAYITGSYDTVNFLSTEEQLKALGVADATGIAKYYGLTRGGYEKVFDAVFYADTYPELKEAYGYDEAKLMQHFRETGMNEGRQAIADFEPYAYRGRYADLYNAYGSNMSAYYYHYMDSGQAEGRDGKPADAEYQVTFMTGESIIDTQMVKFGHWAKEPAVAKEGMNIIYDKDFSCITADLAINITYEPIPEPPTEPETEAPTEPETETLTEPETEAPTEPETELPTEPPTEPETEPPTEPETELPTEPETDTTKRSDITIEVASDAREVNTQANGNIFTKCLAVCLVVLSVSAAAIGIYQYYFKKRKKN